MTSKAYFAIGSLFMFVCVLTIFGAVAEGPQWVPQACTVVFAVAIFLALKKKKQENLLK